MRKEFRRFPPRESATGHSNLPMHSTIDKPKVSVVIPVRNGARYVRQAIRSIQKQTLSDLECIVVDDGSTDRTPEVVERMVREDDRLRMIRLDPSGIAIASNAGTEAARAPVIARMDGDDIAHPKRLEQQLSVLEGHPDLSFLGALERRRLNFQLLWPRWPANTADPDAELTRLTFEDFAQETHFIHPTLVFRTKAIERLGGYDDTFHYGEDSDLYLRATAAGEPFARLETRLLLYRYHTGQATYGSTCIAAELSYFRTAHGVKLPAKLSRTNSPEMLSLARQLLIEQGIPGHWATPSDQLKFARIIRVTHADPISDWNALYDAYCHTIEALPPDKRFGRALDLLNEARAYRER